jgi:prevent-host-death family protein
MKLENIVPITELKRKAAGLVKRAADAQSPIIITQHGRATAVIEDIHSYEQRQKSMAMLELELQRQTASLRAARSRTRKRNGRMSGRRRAGVL